MANSAQYYGTWGYTDNRYYSCSSGSYSSLASCTRRSLSYYSSHCNSDDQVGLWCATVPSTGEYTFKHGDTILVVCFTQVCTNGAVRLVGGQSSNEGRLEYCYNGAWTQLCYSNFHNEEALAACRQLGYTSPSKNLLIITLYSTITTTLIIIEAVIYTDGSFGPKSNFSLISYFSCPTSSSSTTRFSSCSLVASSSCAYKCSGNNVGIGCFGELVSIILYSYYNYF